MRLTVAPIFMDTRVEVADGVQMLPDELAVISYIVIF